MKTNTIARLSLAFACGAAIALLCGYSTQDRESTCGNDASAKVDIDFTRMNPTLRMTYSYRLTADPREFAGKTIRISGTFLTRVDEEDGKRYFGCLMGDEGGCACCAPGGVLEFMPKSSYVWPTGFPPVQSRITITGKLKLFKVGDNMLRQPSYTIPRLTDADFEEGRRKGE